MKKARETARYPRPMVRAMALGLSSFSILLMIGCSHDNDYPAESTWRCLAKKGLWARLESSPDMVKGVDVFVTFQRFATTPDEPVASGGFAFVRKGTRPETVKDQFLKNQLHAIGGRPNAPGYEYGQPTRNVIPWWSDTADSTFKSSATGCLR